MGWVTNYIIIDDDTDDDDNDDFLMNAIDKSFDDGIRYVWWKKCWSDNVHAVLCRDGWM